MTRLNMVVEGRTEETFVRGLLSPYLAERGTYAVARCIKTGRDTRLNRDHRGGMTSYARAKKDMERWLANDEAHLTTMFDLYALPNDFPGWESARHCPDPFQKVELLENALALDIQDPKFIPYIQLHEFEALLLADPARFDAYFIEENDAPGIKKLVSLAMTFPTPEHINESELTAPSKRIIAELPRYAKAKNQAGPLVAEKIGIEVMRAKCAHFNDWLRRLESLA